MFGRKKKDIPLVEYNPETMKPIIKCSICNGEQVAGFKDKASGRFIEVMLLSCDADLESFKKMYNLSEVTKEY